MTNITNQRLRLLSMVLSLLALFAAVKGVLNPGFYTGIIMYLSMFGIGVIEIARESKKTWKIYYVSFSVLFLVLAVINLMAR